MANMNFGVNILPKANNTYSLGNSNYKWNIYANTINGTAVSELGLPAVDSTNNGQVLQVNNGGWAVGAAKLNASEKGAANGVASLDSTGKVPTSQLPAVGSGLPNVTSADNGKSLDVISGQWTVGTEKLDKNYVLRTESKTWNGFTSFDGYNIWSDGNNIYYSYNSDQYVLDKSTSTWSIKEWTGLTNFVGNRVWSDGDNIYYSTSGSNYVLDKSTSTWSTKIWNGLTNFFGDGVWTDGNNIYYNRNSDKYILDKSTSTWSTQTWNIDFSGSGVWTDGDNIYYSNNSSQYVLDKTTSTWNPKTWIGLTNFNGYDIWSGEGNIYYSSGYDQYVLDKSTSTWSVKTWSGLGFFYGRYIWTDGSNTYYSCDSDQYIMQIGDLRILLGNNNVFENVPVSRLTELFGSDLPNVTSADNGKVLLANAGTWTISTSLFPTKVSDLINDSGFLTSVPAMTGATSGTAGAAGLVPAPATTDTNYFLRGDGTWASADTWGGTTYSPYSYIQDSEYYIPARASMNGTSMSSIWVSSTPNIHALAKYDANKYLYSTTPGTSDNSTKVATTAFVNNVLPSTMTGATSSAAGTAGLIPAPASADREKFFRGDGTWQDGGKPMVILSYGNSTWADFIAAYNSNVIVYCRASSNANPKTGSQTRMAFMAYVNNSETPTTVEFQYYRSVNPNQKSASQMSDQVFVYTLTNANGGTWSVTTRQASIQSIAAASGSKIGVSYSNSVVTLSNTMTAADMPMSDSDATTTNSAISTLATQIETLNNNQLDITTMAYTTNNNGYATDTIPTGRYVYKQGSLRIALTDLVSGTYINSNNSSPVNNGGLNSLKEQIETLNSKINTSLLATNSSLTGTNAVSVNVNNESGKRFIGYVYISPSNSSDIYTSYGLYIITKHNDNDYHVSEIHKLNISGDINLTSFETRNNNFILTFSSNLSVFVDAFVYVY